MSRVLILPACPICQDESSNDQFLFTLCGHGFHSSCIRRWDETQRNQKRQTKCPCCNSMLKRISNATHQSKSNKSLGSRFVSIHSLSEKIINRSSSPVLSSSSSNNLPSTTTTESKDQHQHQSLLQQIIRFKNQIHQQEIEIQELKKTPDLLRHQNSQLQSKSTALERELNLTKLREKAGLDKLSNELSLEKRCRKEEIQVIRHECKSLQEQSNERRRMCIRLESERDEFQSKYTKQSRELEDTVDNLISFSEENKKLKTDHATLWTEFQTVKSAVRSLKQRSATFESKYEKYKAEVLMLRKEASTRPSSSNNQTLTSTSTSRIFPTLSTPANLSSSSLQSSLPKPKPKPSDLSTQISPSSSKLPTSTSSPPNLNPYPFLFRKRPAASASSTSRVLQPVLSPTNLSTTTSLRSPKSDTSLNLTPKPLLPKFQSGLPKDSESSEPKHFKNPSKPSLSMNIRPPKRPISVLDPSAPSSSSIEIVNPLKKSDSQTAEMDLCLPSLFGTTNPNKRFKLGLKLQGGGDRSCSRRIIPSTTQKGVLAIGPKIRNR